MTKRLAENDDDAKQSDGPRADADGKRSAKRLADRTPDWQRVEYVMLPKRLTHRHAGLSASAFDMVAHFIAMTFKSYGGKRHALAMDAGKGQPKKKAARLYRKRQEQITRELPPEPAVLEFRSGRALRLALHRPNRNTAAWEAMRQEIMKLRREEIIVGGVPITAITKLHIPRTGKVRVTIHEDLLESGNTIKVKLPVMKRRQSAAKVQLFILVANWTEARGGEKRVFSITLRKLGDKIGMPGHWPLWRIRQKVRGMVGKIKGCGVKFKDGKAIFWRVEKPKV